MESDQKNRNLKQTYTVGQYGNWKLKPKKGLVSYVEGRTYFEVIQTLNS
jgi:hypothetical protein